MTFKEFAIEKSYINRGSNNFLDSLLKPALREAAYYRRSVGFFSSSVFSLLLNSLPSFIRNNGKIHLIVSPELSNDDIKAIQLGYEKKSDLLNRRFLEDFDAEIRLFDDVGLDTLAELVARGILDVKVASVKNDFGIHHDKLGILTDKVGNNVVFYGSPNSSANAYLNNYEKIRVVRDWIQGEGEAVRDEISEFDSMWENRNPYLEVFDFMESVKECILVVKEERSRGNKVKDPIELYDYQKNAIQAWVDKGFRGFYVMATGTGKTWTAIYSAKRLLEEHKCLIVIAAPYKHLVRQWAEDVNKLFPDAETVLISSENPQWYTISKRLVLSQQYHPEKQIILITTIKSFYSAKFEKVINLSDEEKLLIVDEAHRFTQRPENLMRAYSYMLGLSATPINGKQNESGIALLDFFGGLAYNLPIEEALERNFLVHYNYFPVYVTATSAEEENINAISSNMAGCFRDGVLIDRERFVKYVRARLRIMGMAEEKLARIKNFVDQIKEKDHFVVYCGDGRLFDEQDEEIRHIQFVQNQMDDMGIRTSQFTANENMDRRMELVDMFNKQEIDALVAIRCLDEGINIPSIKSALILSSNDDYREFVQRRGRILRKYKGKKSADIYDVVVLPSAMCPKMAIIELRRYYEYAKLALNKEERLAELQTLLSQYGLRLEDIMFNTDLEVEVDLDE